MGEPVDSGNGRDTAALQPGRASFAIPADNHLPDDFV